MGNRLQTETCRHLQACPSFLSSEFDVRAQVAPKFKLKFQFRACCDLAFFLSQIYPALCLEYCIVLGWSLKQI